MKHWWNTCSAGCVKSAIKQFVAEQGAGRKVGAFLHSLAHWGGPLEHVILAQGAERGGRKTRVEQGEGGQGTGKRWAGNWTDQAW